MSDSLMRGHLLCLTPIELFPSLGRLSDWQFIAVPYLRGGWMHHLFVYLLEQYKALLHCYYSIALRISIGDVCASAICLLWRIIYSLLLYKLAFICLSCFFSGLSYFLHFSLLSLLHHALSLRLGGSWPCAWAYSPMTFDISFRPLRIAVVDRDHLYLN